MMQSINNIMLLTLTFTFSQMKHPLAMGFMLLLQTLIICTITGMMHKNFWFSYILFLVFLGGMLVLFIYVTSLASNEMFNFSMKLFISTMMIMMLMLSINLITDNMLYTLIYNNEMINNMNTYIIKESIETINKLYNFPTNLITLLLINYLFFCLIVVVKITNFFYGPIRNLN